MAVHQAIIAVGLSAASLLIYCKGMSSHLSHTSYCDFNGLCDFNYLCKYKCLPLSTVQLIHQDAGHVLYRLRKSNLVMFIDTTGTYSIVY